MICAHCRMQNLVDARFCGFCGSALKGGPSWLTGFGHTFLWIAGAAIGLVALLAILVSQVFFREDDTGFLVVTRFGQFQGDVRSPGLHNKLPFVDVVNLFDRRLLHIDLRRTTMLEVDKHLLEIDAYVRYRIANPRKFMQRVTNEPTAGDVIANIVIFGIREEVARRTLANIPNAEVVSKEMARRVLTGNNAIVSSQENDFGVTIVEIFLKVQTRD